MNRRTSLLAGLLLAVVCVGVCGSLYAQGGNIDHVIISEIVANNRASLKSVEGSSPDWIELYNLSDHPVSLLGWALTDDSREIAKWPFPDITLGAGEFLVVFASGDDLRDPAGELHTNFNLSDQGEFLALTDSSGVFVSFFAPMYPEQIRDISYGVPMTILAEKLASAGDTARYLIPPDATLGVTWVEPGFDDSAWPSGPTGVGFDLKEAPTLTDLIQTDLGPSVSVAEQDVYSVFVRIPFTVAEDDVARPLRLRVQFEDGFAAFINGAEVLRDRISATTTLGDRTRALSGRDEADTRTFAVYEIEATDLLQPGENVLAIQVANYRRSTTEDVLDLVLVPELEITRVESVDVENPGYFEVPTPGKPNGDTAYPAIAARPEFLLPAGAYVEALPIELSAPSGGQIRYTTDGTEPTAESPLYVDAIPMNAAVTVKAKVYETDRIPSPTVTQTYMRVDQSVFDFNSNLPVVFCTTIGTGIGAACDGLYTPGHFLVYTPGGDGRTRLSDDPHVADIAAFRKRGSSTCNRPKFSFNVEVKQSFDPEDAAEAAYELRARDPLGKAKDVSIFGFPADSDWVMYGPYNFDRALMRNAVAYWMSREVGPWAARTRFVECFFNASPGVAPRPSMSMGNYMGVYIFMEKNKKHSDRVDVEGLTADVNSPTDPLIEGGYIFRRDRVGAGEIAITAGGYSSLVFVYPKIPTVGQRTWITNYLNQAIGSLSPNIGSQEDSDLIDVQEWLDHHILNWYPKNVDGFRLSGYFYKRRDGKMIMGPVWDYDRTMGCADDDRAASPIGWDNTASGDGGTRYFQSGGLGSWYSVLFQNVPPTGTSPWARAYRRRWGELRDGPLRSETIAAQVDAYGAELAEAAVRNFNKWTGVRPRTSFQWEVDHLRDWLIQRAEWIDSQFIEPPMIDPLPLPGGELVAVGLQVTLTAPDGQIYYTTDGSDPKTATGGLSATAILYAGPITITQNAKITARVRIGTSTWSELVDGFYVTSIPTLALSEIMYNSPSFPGDTYSAGRDYDFLELLNYGDEPVSLAGFRVDRPTFAFSEGSVPVLQPGERLVVVDNLLAFQERYGDGLPVAGEYGSSLSNTRMTVALLGAVGETLVEVRYDDDWYPDTTDGQGSSLVLKDPVPPPAEWSNAESWQPSAAAGGSPGTGEGLPPNQLPADFSQDGILNVTDAVGILEFQFLGRPGPCEEHAGNLKLVDATGDDRLNITDAVRVLSYLFLGGLPPALGETCVYIPGCPEVCAQ